MGRFKGGYPDRHSRKSSIRDVYTLLIGKSLAELTTPGAEMPAEQAAFMGMMIEYAAMRGHTRPEPGQMQFAASKEELVEFIQTSPTPYARLLRGERITKDEMDAELLRFFAPTPGHEGAPS